MGEELGQQIVSDNRGGAGGIIGAEIVARSPPDGYTLLVSSTGMQVITPQIYKKLNYDPVNDFAPLSLFAVTQNILVVNPTLPLNSVKELIAYAKANPGKLNMSNAGAGFQSHLAGVLFTHVTGIDVHQVPYKGGASLIAVIGNESQFTIAPGPSVMAHVRSGRLRALATGGEKRSPQTPELADHQRGRRAGLCVDRLGRTDGAEGRRQTGVRQAVCGAGRVPSTIPRPASCSSARAATRSTSTPAEFVKLINEEYRRYGEAIGWRI